jgi:hypothetical protein
MKYFLIRYNKIISLAFIALVIFTIALPTQTFSQVGSGCEGFVCCSGPDCKFESIKQNVEHIITEVLKYAFAAISLMFAYAGYVYIMAKGDPGEVKHAHEMFTNVLIGAIVVLLAYAIVKTLITSLGLQDDVLQLE